MRALSTPLKPSLVRLLAALLLLQWGTAFGHCLRLVAPPAAWTVELCTAEGPRHLTLPAEQDGSRGHDLAAGPACPACQGPAPLVLPPPQVGLAPPVLLAQLADPPPPSPAPAPRPPRSCEPRAPPTS